MKFQQKFSLICTISNSRRKEFSLRKKIQIPQKKKNIFSSLQEEDDDNLSQHSDETPQWRRHFKAQQHLDFIKKSNTNIYKLSQLYQVINRMVLDTTLCHWLTLTVCLQNNLSSLSLLCDRERDQTKQISQRDGEPTFATIERIKLHMTLNS